MRAFALLLAPLSLAWTLRAPATVTVEVRANGTARTEKPAEARLNFTQLLSDAGRPGTFDENSLRVEEVTSGGALLDANVPFQFDKDAGYNAASSAAGTLVFILEGQTGASATRYYRVSFDRTGTGAAPPSVPAQLTLTDNVADEGQSSYRIATPLGTWYYHKQGGGFSSLVDLQGNDWLGYRPTGGSAGNYRGIPNAVHPEGYFHPGNTSCTSSIVSQGPIKATISSRSNDGAWECLWEVTPRYARLTVLRNAHAYWFLYEGTPGGALNEATDFCVRSNGTRTPLSQSWTGDIASPEWIYFEDGAVNRSLYLVHHEDDGAVDSYWPMEGNMTVFGFGRDGLNKYLTSVPRRFTVGLAEDRTFSGVSGALNSASRDLALTVTGGGSPPPPPPPPPGNSLNYAYYTGAWIALPDFSALAPAKTGTIGGFDLSPRTQDDNFAFVFTGFLAIPADGLYTFFTSSDDGSKLAIDGMEVVNNDGLHGAQERSGSLTLAAGEHAIAVSYFEAGGGESLAVSWQGPGLPKEPIPSSSLSAAGCGCGSIPPPGGGSSSGGGSGGGCGLTGLEALLLLFALELARRRIRRWRGARSREDGEGADY